MISLEDVCVKFENAAAGTKTDAWSLVDLLEEVLRYGPVVERGTLTLAPAWKDEKEAFNGKSVIVGFEYPLVTFTVIKFGTGSVDLSVEDIAEGGNGS